MRNMVLIGVLMIGVLVGGTVAEAQFTSGELIYVPVVAHNDGTNGSVWRSDLTITNVEHEDSIDVAIVFIPSGLTNNSYLFNDRTYWAGGRDADSFGIVDEQLADIPPLGTVTIGDVVETYWPDNTGSQGMGALVMFSYLADSLEDDGSREDRLMTVGTRTYNVTTIWERRSSRMARHIQTTRAFRWYPRWSFRRWLTYSTFRYSAWPLV